MSWLLSYTLASLAASFLVVKLFDYIVGEATSGLVSLARCVIFIATWTAVTAKVGMNAITKRVRQFKQRHTKAIAAFLRRRLGGNV